jgi:hypothetical protein
MKSNIYLMTLRISEDRPDSADALALIDELERYLAPMYPHDSEHGLSAAGLVSQGVAFFIIRCDDRPAGCGGLKLCGTDCGEIIHLSFE